MTFRDAGDDEEGDIVVARVKDGGHAFTEGGNAGDVLVSINGDSATNFEDAADATESLTDLKGKEHAHEGGIPTPCWSSSRPLQRG